MAKLVREITLQLTVTIPARVGESEVESAINAALDENPKTGLDWGDWKVGAAKIVDVKKREAAKGE